jgi:hypothetical protein
MLNVVNWLIDASAFKVALASSRGSMKTPAGCPCHAAVVVDLVRKAARE